MMKQDKEVDYFLKFLQKLPKDVHSQMMAVNATLETILIAEHLEYYKKKTMKKPSQALLDRQIDELLHNENAPKNTILYVQLLKKIFIQN